jgi:NitT/TauT family transport system ATP-binding protein
MTSALLSLPDYRDLPPEVIARFERIAQRPVALEVTDLDKRFGPLGKETEVLRKISFEVRRREFVCVLGASGCGKSTLIRILGGLETCSGGTIRVNGQEVDGAGPDRGMVFQEYTLFPWLTLQQNVMFGPRMTGKGGGDPAAEALQWLEMIGLADRAKAYPHQVSGGMKQRVAIARALANYPGILLMDEPFGALDAQTRMQMQDYLLQIWRNVDVTICFITHDLEEAIYLADRILVLDAHPGRVKEIVKVPLARPRRREMLLSPYFLAMRKRLEELIHHAGKNEGDQDQTLPTLPMIKLTPAGDEVE